MPPLFGADRFARSKLATLQSRRAAFASRLLPDARLNSVAVRSHLVTFTAADMAASSCLHRSESEI